MNNYEFLQTIKQSFITYLNTSPRSNQKLKILHGNIAKDLIERFENNNYSICSLGYELGVEKKMQGRYINKAVDITISEFNNIIAGIGVKFVMSNYKQNSNNYFENMLGETANIRSAALPYFQIIVLPEKLPYFNKDGEVTKWEPITQHNIDKYVTLSTDNIDSFIHTPNKTLLYLVNLTTSSSTICDKKSYVNFFLNNEFEVIPSETTFNFGQTVIYNNYELFADKIVHAIKSI